MTDFIRGDIFDIKFNTRQSNGTPITLAGSPNVEVYEDNSTTQITGGDTLSVDFDGITGLHNLNINSATIHGYESGKSYTAVMSAGTVDGVSVVGAIVGRWTLERATLSSAALTNIRTEIDANSTQLAAIVADTSELQTDDVPGLIAALNDITAAAVRTEMDSNSTQLAAIVADTSELQTDDIPGTLATMTTHLTDIKGGTFSGATDSLEAIRDRGDSAWTTGAGGTPPQLLQNTTIATLASQTSFTLAAGSADNDAYNGAVAVVTDQSTSTQKAVGSISDYVGSTKTVTLSADPGVFTMAIGDTIDIIANASTAPSAAAVRAEIDSNSTQLAAIVADTSELQTDDIPGLIAALDTLIDAIKAKTDQLAFGVANQVDANVESINTQTVTGDGGAGTEWGGA